MASASAMNVQQAAVEVPAPAVSVVVPVYNARLHLAACLDGILGQNVRDVELIVVDDGSEDGSAALLAERASRDPRVVVARHEGGRNRGAAASRNLGLRRARGEYIWFVDADDRVRAGAIATLLACARESGAEIVAFNGEECGGGLPAVPVYRQAKPPGVVRGEAWVACGCRQKEWRHFVWLRFYRRDYLARCGLVFREGIVHEDIAWITEGDLRATRLVYLDEILYDYTRNPESVSRASSDASLFARAESMITVVAQLRDINERCPMSEATRRLLRAELVGQAVNVDRLRRRIGNPELRRALGQRLRRERFWRGLWRDAIGYTRKRQLARIVWRELFEYGIGSAGSARGEGR